jgi:hypothetical protein
MLKLNFKEGPKRNRSKFESPGTVNADPMQKEWEEELTESPNPQTQVKWKNKVMKTRVKIVFEALIFARSF